MKSEKFLVIASKDQAENLKIIEFLKEKFQASNTFCLNGEILSNRVYYYIDSDNIIRCINEVDLNMSRFCGLLINYKIITFDSLLKMYNKQPSIKEQYLKKMSDLLEEGKDIFDEKDKEILKELSILKNKFSTIKEEKLSKIKNREDLMNNLFVDFKIINSNFYYLEGSSSTKEDRENEIKLYKNILQATAVIYELLPFYGGKISIEEWKDKTLDKYYILEKNGEFVVSNTKNYKNHLSFHSEQEAQEFLKNNLNIVKYYFYGRVDI